MSKSRNSKTQAEAIAEFDAQRAVDPNAGQDTAMTPPAPEKRTRKNRPVGLYRDESSLDDGEYPLSQLSRVVDDEFPTETAAWDWAEANNVDGRLCTIIVTESRTATVETVKKVTWA